MAAEAIKTTLDTITTGAEGDIETAAETGVEKEKITVLENKLKVVEKIVITISGET
jgi:hypothetical protein